MSQARFADVVGIGGPLRFEIGGPLGCVFEQDTSTVTHTGAAQWRPAMAFFVKLFGAN